MPRLSLYTPEKSNNYRYFDRLISEQFTVGGTDLYIHKMIGSGNPANPTDISPTKIEDIVFLENRDRIYEDDIIRMRGHYNVQNLDFDLSQFGLFLNNDIIFITVHYNDMLDIVGRKLMNGDVIELPHLNDYDSLDQTIKTILRRYYVITDANLASEGFSQTWYPHLWRIKCERMTDSQEFAQILNKPAEQTDTYLGTWDATKTYPAGYTITYGDKNYTATVDVPVNITPPNDAYWKLDTSQTARDVVSMYKKYIEINDGALEEARRNVPLSGYDVSNLYVVPVYDELDPRRDQPAPPSPLLATNGPPTVARGAVITMRNPKYRNGSPVLRIPRSTVMSLWDMTVDSDASISSKIDKFIQLSLENITIQPQLTDTGSGSVEVTNAIAVHAMGPVTGPYGTADNTYATSDQDPGKRGFTGTITQQMDYRADCDPRFQYIARYSPRSWGYVDGYLIGTGAAPNGIPAGAGITFPQNPNVGDYFLRIDYYPQLLFRWDGRIWVRISEKVRTLHLEWTEQNESQTSSFINNTKTTKTSSGGVVPQRQALSSILRITPDSYNQPK